MKVNDNSFATFIYPFELMSPADFETRTEKIDGAMSSNLHIWKRRWKQRGFIDDNLLPHIGRYLNPDIDSIATARLWRLNPNLLQSPAFLDGGSKNTSSKWCLNFPNSERWPNGVEFRWLEIQLVLFRIGVGFLVITTRPVSEYAEDWYDFNHYFRFSAGQRCTTLLASRKTPTGFVPWFAEIAIPKRKRSDGKGLLQEIIDGLIETARLDNETDAWCRDIYTPNRLLPYLSIFYSNINSGDEAETVLRTRRFFHSSQKLIGTPDELDTSSNSSLLNYAQRQWFTFSKEGFAFIAMDAPDEQFFMETLPNHLADHYLLMLLISLHQRFALLTMSEKTAVFTLKKSDNLPKHSEPLLLNERWTEFMTYGYFNQVAQSDSHHRFYSRCQDVNDIDELYSNVRAQIEHIYSKEISNGIRSNVKSITKAQHALHIVEYLIAAFYGAELLHLIDSHSHLAKWIERLTGFSSDFSHGVSIVLFAIAGIAFVEVVNRRIEGRWVIIGAIKGVWQSLLRLPSAVIRRLSLGSSS